MVTGVKPDEQVEWSEVSWLSDAIDELSVRLFGVHAWELPSWISELCGLEAEHAEARLRGRARRRLSSLRKRERAMGARLVRRGQRRLIGLP
ncbi:hypothetical protein ACXR2W_00930 [Leucobacter sp. HY1908]